VICADESDAYDRLPAKYAVRRVNHGKAYRADDGTTNNLAESYFSRFRRPPNFGVPTRRLVGEDSPIIDKTAFMAFDPPAETTPIDSAAAIFRDFADHAR
jgi:hypothetical protein